MKKTASLQDVARVAGVSTSTASRVLNGTGRASQQTRERIFHAAERLDFRPDALARFFATGRSSTVGILSRAEPASFALPVLVGAQRALGGRDLAALIYYSDGRADTHQEHLRKLRARRVEGVIFLGQSPDEIYPSVGSAIGAPVVYAYARSDDAADISIVPDGVMAGRLAGEHLIGLGRRRIAHITGPADLPAVKERAAGLRAVLDEAGLPLVFGRPFYGEDWRYHIGVRAAEKILASKRRVDAIFCANDQIALGTHRVLQQAGVHVPEDIAIVGYDHWSRLHGAPDPFLTTIDPNLPSLGAAAVDHLLRAMAGEPLRGIQKHPCELVSGESTMGCDAIWPSPTAEPAV